MNKTQKHYNITTGKYRKLYFISKVIIFGIVLIILCCLYNYFPLSEKQSKTITLSTVTSNETEGLRFNIINKKINEISKINKKKAYKMNNYSVHNGCEYNEVNNQIGLEIPGRYSKQSIPIIGNYIVEKLFEIFFDKKENVAKIEEKSKIIKENMIINEGYLEKSEKEVVTEESSEQRIQDETDTEHDNNQKLQDEIDTEQSNNQVLQDEIDTEQSNNQKLQDEIDTEQSNNQKFQGEIDTEQINDQKIQDEINTEQCYNQKILDETNTQQCIDKIKQDKIETEQTDNNIIENNNEISTDYNCSSANNGLSGENECNDSVLLNENDFEESKNNTQLIKPVDQKIQIQKTRDDINVIPDKFNTGVGSQITLEKVELNQTYNNIYFKKGSSGICLEFLYFNQDAPSKVVIENADFSNYEFCTLHDKNQDREVYFNNCKFGSIRISRQSGIQYNFKNCTIKAFSGSNSTFSYCAFGGGNYDAIIPFENVSINNCYISDMSHYSSSGTIHTDGTQIYGWEDIIASNIKFSNTRFEVPQLYTESTSNYINACIMLQLEFNDGNNITFNNCILNGGGYSIYARSKSDKFTLYNTAFSNIRIGNAKKYGNIYPNPSKEVVFSNIENTDELYVSSIWKDNKIIHFAVSNDTSEERKLKVVTNRGEYFFTIPAMPSADEIYSNRYTFKELPIDLEKIINDDCEWIIFYDMTVQENPKQIRYFNWLE